VERRLAAILAADVAGYSRLMGEDSAGTLDALRRLRTEVLGPVCTGQGGRIVKSMGDGWLVEFSSAVDAVTAAMRIQDQTANGTGLRLRIGVHVGDVTEDEDDLFGDGVNIAARLEGEADPGGIVISDTVHASLDGTLAPSFDPGGERALKNIIRPVRIWARAPVRPATAAEAAADPARDPKAGFPQLAILPVAASDPRIEVRDLAEALGADFATFFATIVWLRSAITETPAPDAYVLRTALRARGDRLRFEARLTDPQGREIWTGKHDSTLADSFDWQDEIGEAVVSNGMNAILDAEIHKIKRLPDADLTAAQCLLMGMMTWRNFEPDSFARAAAYHARAIEADPDMAAAYAEAIVVTVAGKTVGYHDSLARFAERLPQWMNAAGKFAGESPILDLNLAIGRFFEDRDAAAFTMKLTDILRRAPFDARVMSFAGWGYIWAGRVNLAVDCFETSLRLGRFGPFYVAALGGASRAAFMLGRDAESLAYAERGLEISTTYASLHSCAACAHVMLGNEDKAREAMRRFQDLVPGVTISGQAAYRDYGGSDGGKRIFEALRRAGLPE
jgi:adenylate cyclase